MEEPTADSVSLLEDPPPVPPLVSSWTPRGFFFFYPSPMQELTQTTTPNASQEALITREITFRNSTFGALKTFMRDHKWRTGETLSNAAAVDMILRAHLARHIHQDAVKTMWRLAQPQTIAVLQALPREPEEESPVAPVATPTPRAASIINVGNLNRPRPFVRPSGDVKGGQE